MRGDGGRKLHDGMLWCARRSTPGSPKVALGRAALSLRGDVEFTMGPWAWVACWHNVR